MKKKLLSILLMGCVLLSACGQAKTEAEGPDGDVDTAAIEVKPEPSESTAMVETETEEPVKIQTLTITATGDCTLGKTQEQGYEGSFWAYYDSYGADYFFSGVKDVFENDDFTLINLECVLTDSDNRVEKTYNLKGKPEYTAIMTGSSVEACSLGNNHSRDYGEQSLVDTENNLDAADIKYGYNDHIGVYTTEEGLVVGVVSANLLSMSDEYVNYLKDGIATLKAQSADLIIACCHWGIERQYYPNDYQQKIAHELVDAGADLVVGNHPHVLQGMELYNGKMICYSLGNFSFGANRNPTDKDTLMYQQTFTYIDGQLSTDNLDVKIIPCRLSSVTSHNDFQPTILDGDAKQKIINNMNSYSSPYSNISFDAEGAMVISE